MLILNQKRDSRMGEKLEPQLKGPYKIIEILSTGAVRLEGIKRLTSISNIRLYYSIDGSSNKYIEYKTNS